MVTIAEEQFFQLMKTDNSSNYLTWFYDRMIYPGNPSEVTMTNMGITDWCPANNKQYEI